MLASGKKSGVPRALLPSPRDENGGVLEGGTTLGVSLEVSPRSRPHERKGGDIPGVDVSAHVRRLLATPLLLSGRVSRFVQNRDAMIAKRDGE